VNGVAGLAPHVQRGVPAAFLGDVEPCVWQVRQRFWPLVAGGRQQQLKLVVGLVRIVALKAIAHSWRMDLAFEIGCILVGMAGDA